MADELMEILSAPSRNSALKSSTLRMPPPTVNGINTLAATWRTISTTVSLASEDAVISRNTTSSAPASSYAFAMATGSPASTKSTKLTPFTTRPLCTSRQGMILFVNINSSPHILWLSCIRAPQNFSKSAIPHHCFFPGGTDMQTRSLAQPMREYGCHIP